MKVSAASGSAVESVPTTLPTARFSAMELTERAMSVGDSLTFVTVTAIAFVAVSVPSLTCTVTS